MQTQDPALFTLTIDIVIFALQHESLRVLLIQRADDPFQGFWALPGGFVNPNESLEQAATRELHKETGLSQLYLEQLYTYGDPHRHPRSRIVTVAYFALIPADAPIDEKSAAHAARCAWFPASDLPALAFDHTEIIDYALRRLRYKLEYSAVGFQLLPEYFTLSEIQRTYEIILGEKLDKRNFRRRILAARIIEPARYKRIGEGRPAQLYRYRPDAVAEIKARRLFP